MSRQLVVVAGDRDRAYLPTFLAEAHPELDARCVGDVQSLRAALAGRYEETRLVSFLNDLIIPADVIEGLRVQPINVHPGPPEYRGSCPDGFAWLDGAAVFGVTAHEMTAEIDAGRILAVRRFPLEHGAMQAQIADLAFENALVLFALVLRHCARSDDPLPPTGERWSGPNRTKAMFRAALKSRRVTEAGGPARSRAG
ncbi:MAG: formyltransferase family protein [Pseudomonadota bacterium]